MIEQIRGSQYPEPIAGGQYSLQAPGLQAIVEVIPVERTSTRAAGAGSMLEQLPLLSALEQLDIILVKQMEITVVTDMYASQPNISTRSGEGASIEQGKAAILLRSPRMQADQRTAVLLTDESGEQHWIFPHSKSDEEFVFALPRAVATPQVPPEETENTRGAVTKSIRKVVRVLTWIFDRQLATAALAIVKHFEEKRRPYELLRATESGLVTHIPWTEFNEKPVLLLLHGTFSTSSAAFDGLFRSGLFQRYLQQYEGRIIAFNHPSLHQDPVENVDHLLGQLPVEAKSLHFDLVTHSRGALVGRALCARQGTVDGREIRVGKAVFVAGPNAGTKLVDAQYLVQLLDSYTNMLTQLPDTITTIVLEAIISLVKVIGSGAVDHLPGLQAMLPEGAFLKQLDSSKLGATQAYAMGAHYNPSDDRFLIRLGQRAINAALARIFTENNDMVVPTAGCYGGHSSFSVPETHRIDYSAKNNINHLTFFQHEPVNSQILDWLGKNDFQ